MTTILLIEDSDGQRAEARAALRDCGLFDRILEASDGLAGLRLLLSESIDLVLCDLHVPGIDGGKLLRVRGECQANGVEVPFVVLTATTDADRRARLIQEGASDVITKPFHAVDLVARLSLHLKLMRAQAELMEKNRALERLSTTDALTGLPNRRRLEAALDAEIVRSLRTGSPFAVAMADIDHFKRVNDQHGHAAGDVALREVARVLSDSLRATDCGGRFGGEEFLVVLCDNDAQGAEVFAERWRQSVERALICLDYGETLQVTLSIGVSMWRSGVTGVATLLAEADEALYAAKAAGRNQVIVADA